MGSDAELAQVAEVAHGVHAVELEARVLLRHAGAPAAVHHDLATEVQLEEELVDELAHLGVLQDRHGLGNLHDGGVDVQLESDEVVLGGDLLDEPQGRHVVVRPGGDGRVEEVVDGLHAVGHALPEVLGLQQGVLVAVVLVECNLPLRG